MIFGLSLRLDILPTLHHRSKDGEINDTPNCLLDRHRSINLLNNTPGW